VRYILLAIFGLLGVFARYFANSLFVNILNLGFPSATISINILGSFLIGFLYEGSVQSAAISDDLRIAMMAGLLGGFTTFSAFSLDTVSMFAEGRFTHASLYVLGTVGGGIAATIFGLYLGKLAFGT